MKKKVARRRGINRPGFEEKIIFGKIFVLLVGDAGVEPTAFGSGDQRSIHLS